MLSPGKLGMPQTGCGLPRFGEHPQRVPLPCPPPAARQQESTAAASSKPRLQRSRAGDEEGN